MDISACSNCGSQRLRWAAGSEGRAGIELPESDRWCRDCQNRGTALLFDDEVEWRRFREERQAALLAAERGGA